MTSLSSLRLLAGKATKGPWKSMREGNQYIDTDYLPTAELVSASRVDGLVRPWNPHAAHAFGFKPADHETVRFKDADADYIAMLSPAFVLKMVAVCEAAVYAASDPEALYAALQQLSSASENEERRMALKEE